MFSLSSRLFWIRLQTYSDQLTDKALLIRFIYDKILSHQIKLEEKGHSRASVFPNRSLQSSFFYLLHEMGYRLQLSCSVKGGSPFSLTLDVCSFHCLLLRLRNKLYAKLRLVITFKFLSWMFLKSPFQQGHPTTIFCKISVRRSKCCLEISFAWGRLNLLEERSN